MPSYPPMEAGAHSAAGRACLGSRRRRSRSRPQAARPAACAASGFGLCGLELAEVALHVSAHAPVWQVDVFQHLRKARAHAEAEGSLFFHAFASTARRLAERLGGLAAAQRRPYAAAAPCD